MDDQPKFIFGVGVKNDPAYGLPRKGPGPVKWCKKCSRLHPARAVCNLYLRTRTAKSGANVQRWCH